MNPEPIKELKEKYFAAHWGQEVLTWEGNTIPVLIDSTALPSVEPFLLSLRPISALTDAEAIEVAKIVSKYTGRIEIGDKIKVGMFFNLPFVGVQLLFRTKKLVFHQRKSEFKEFEPIASYAHNYGEMYDYLRSISIALPFMGHSVDSLISAGWLKLREGGES